jgi:8-oxo-dGTP pyrophosphatase MutT (NUDIX family)
MLEATVREAREETGLTIEVTRLLGVDSAPEDRIVSYPDNDVQLLDILLEAAVFWGDLVCSSENIELRFFPAGDFPAEEEIVPPARLPFREVVAGACGMIR